MNLTKLAIPTLFAVIIAGAVVGTWVEQIIQHSFRTHGTMFSEYAPTFPAVKNSTPSEASFCTPEYKTRWAGCTLTQALK